MADSFKRRVAIIGGVRTPFCRSNTLYAELTNLDLMTTVLQGLADKFGLNGVHIDEVVGGAVVTHAKDWNLAREAVIGTKLAPSTPGITMIQACGTSLQAAMGSAAKIACGEIECAIAVGSDTTSDPPVVFRRSMARKLAAASRSRSTMETIKTLASVRPGDLAPMAPSTSEPRTGLAMGEHCELMAKQWQIPRAEQDALAFESHRKAAKAYDDGFLDDLLVPCAGVYRDNNVRADIELEKLAALKTVFDRSEAGTLTAANSTPLTDGAAAVLLASEDWARKRGLPVLAYLTHAQHAALDFVAGEGLLMAPTLAVARLLERTGLTTAGFRPLRDPRGLRGASPVHAEGLGVRRLCPHSTSARRSPLGSIDRAKMNVMGSSIAFGHPVRGDRRAHRRQPRQTLVAARRAAG